jgi:L-cystine transport system substrate-binding protein
MKGKSVVFAALALAALGAGTVYGGGGSAGKSPAPPGVRRVRVAYVQNSRPINFTNERGEADGFEPQMLKAADALIPDYEFEFVGTTDEDLLAGIETGKYGLGVKGAWDTEERRRKFIIPRNYIAASVIGLAIRTENGDQIRDMESFARFSGKLVPISPQNAQWAVVEDYNKANPKAPVKLVPAEAFSVADAWTWLLEGRYDAFFTTKTGYENQVLKPAGAYYQFQDRLRYIPHLSIPTYPIFNRNYQDLADKYSAAIEELHRNGMVKRLLDQYYDGDDIFAYIEATKSITF